MEQEVNAVFINFFGFNRTARMWRIQVLEECGGWLERTTVEDMDIVARAHLYGWMSRPKTQMVDLRHMTDHRGLITCTETSGSNINFITN